MATKLRRSIFIGLGGTGMKTILKTKSVLMDNYGQNGELPPMFTFVGIDTDSNEYDKTVKSKEEDNLGLSEMEKVSISVSDPKDYFDYMRKEMKWMPHQNVSAIKTLDQGAGQVRSNGRLAFMYNLKRLKERLRKAITDTCNQESYSSKWRDFEVITGGAQEKAKIDVHIVFSICGGTGSGTFLDIAYLMRELEDEAHVSLTINGYAVLPGVFIEQIRDASEKDRVIPNAYGALRELDYLMSVGTDERKVKITWMPKETDETPFDSIILVDNRNTVGVAYSKMEDLTEMLSLALLATTGQIGSDSKSVGDNVKIDMAYKKFNVDGKCAWVAAVGTSTIIFDSEHVARVYELKAQNKLLKALLNADADANAIANNWIDAIAIRENNDQDQVIDALFDIDGIAPFNLTKQDFGRHTAKADVNAKFSIYYQTVMPSPEDWAEKVNALYKTVSEALVKKEKELNNDSLMLQYNFLKEVRSSINDIFIKMMNEELADLENEKTTTKAAFDSRISQLDAYMQQLIRPNVETQVKFVVNAAKEYIVSELEAKRRSYAARFYASLVDFIDTEMRKCDEMINKLVAIAEENNAEVRTLQNRVNGGKTVVIDLAESLIKTVQVSDEDTILVSGLVQHMPKKNLYEAATKEELKAALDAYTVNLPQCVAYRQRTIDDVINEMSNDDFIEVIRRAANYSNPFLNIDSQGRKLKNGHTVGDPEIFYICVPDTKTCRLTQDNFYRKVISAEMATPISTGLTDRIIIYRQKRPVPAFAIGGLEVYREPYEADQEISFHIDEQLQLQMDNEGYGFMPRNANQDEALDAWVKGCVLGFIKFDGYYCYLDFINRGLDESKENWVSTKESFREDAFKIFSENDQLIAEYIKRFQEHIEEIGKKAADELQADVKANYFRKYSRCQVTIKTLESKKEYKETLLLIKKELEHKDEIFDNI